MRDVGVVGHIHVALPFVAVPVTAKAPAHAFLLPVSTTLNNLHTFYIDSGHIIFVVYEFTHFIAC
jgi:hypothetical protein